MSAYRWEEADEVLAGRVLRLLADEANAPRVVAILGMLLQTSLLAAQACGEGEVARLSARAGADVARAQFRRHARAAREGIQ